LRKGGYVVKRRESEGEGKETLPLVFSKMEAGARGEGGSESNGGGRKEREEETSLKKPWRGLGKDLGGKHLAASKQLELRRSIQRFNTLSGQEKNRACI